MSDIVRIDRDRLREEVLRLTDLLKVFTGSRGASSSGCVNGAEQKPTTSAVSLTSMLLL